MNRHAIVLLLAFAAVAVAQPATRPTTRPVFTEDFEAFDRGKWSTVNSEKTVEIVAAGRNGGKCAQATATLGENTGGYLYKMLEPGLETAYLRFYVKFEADHEYVHHFTKLMGYNPPTRWPQGRAGTRRTAPTSSPRASRLGVAMATSRRRACGTSTRITWT